MLHDHGMWSASLSCWLNTAVYSLERHTESLWMSWCGLLMREVRGHLPRRPRWKWDAARATELNHCESSLLLQSCQQLCSYEGLRTHLACLLRLRTTKALHGRHIHLPSLRRSADNRHTYIRHDNKAMQRYWLYCWSCHYAGLTDCAGLNAFISQW